MDNWSTKKKTVEVKGKKMAYVEMGVHWAELSVSGHAPPLEPGPEPRKESHSVDSQIIQPRGD